MEGELVAIQDLENEAYYLVHNLNKVKNADFKNLVLNGGVLNGVGRKGDRWRYGPGNKIANKVEWIMI